MMRNKIRPGARAMLCLAIVSSVAAQMPSYAAANLVVNPGFETSYLPPVVVQQIFNQPVWPTGWLAEGVTALFDHSPHNAHGGQYNAGISGSYSGPRADCSQGPCTTIPGGEAKDLLYQYATVAPAWRTDLPIMVNGSKSYTFSAWMRLSIPKDGTGAITSIRWFDANHLPIRTVAGPKLLAGVGHSSYLDFANGTFVDRSTDWTKGSVTVTSPSNAASATLVLGYSDDAWIGGVSYDDVCFAPTSAAAC